MAYDERLAGRVRDVMAPAGVIGERKMFGGLTFMLNGNMWCGIVGDNLMLRLDPERADEALARPHVRPMDFTGRPMKGFVLVDPPGLAGDDQLRQWIGQAQDYVRSLPAK